MEYTPPNAVSSSCAMKRTSSAVTRSALRCTLLFNKKADANLSLIIRMVSKATRKSPAFCTCRVDTSFASPATNAPLGALARAELFVVPFGRTINSTLLAAALPCTIACVNASRLRRSPIYSSMKPRP